MRLRLLPLACAAALAAGLTGCGSSATHSSAASPEQSELAYFPAGSPLIVAVQTSPDSQAAKGLQQLEDRLPIAALGTSAAKSKLSQIGINYDTDIRPLLGNPIIFGVTSNTIGRGSTQLLAVWRTRNASKLAALLRKIPGLRQSGTRAGATLYTFGDMALARSGATLLAGRSATELGYALSHHSAGGARVPAGVPANALVAVFGNLVGELSTPGAAKARRVPWVAALRAYSTALSAGPGGLNLSFRLDTTRSSLAPAQLPLAPGSGTPAFAGNLPITVSLLDPAHVFTFVEQAEAEAAPASYARFQRRQAQLRAHTGVNLNSLLALATGDLIIAGNTRTYYVRVGLSNAPAAASDLRRLLSAPQFLFKQRTAVRSLGGGFYTLTQKRESITVGVASGQLVAGFSPPSSGHTAASALPATPSALGAFAGAPTTAATGARGTLAFRISLPTLLALTLRHQPSALVAPVLQMLGDITGWAAETPSALSGSASLAIH